MNSLAHPSIGWGYGRGNPSLILSYIVGSPNDRITNPGSLRRGEFDLEPNDVPTNWELNEFFPSAYGLLILEAVAASKSPTPL